MIIPVPDINGARDFMVQSREGEAPASLVISDLFVALDEAARPQVPKRHHKHVRAALIDSNCQPKHRAWAHPADLKFRSRRKC